MSDILIIIISVQIVVALIVVFANFKTLNAYRNIDKSFTKLGFIIREDSKKYFEEVSGKILADNKVAEEINKKMITEALIQAVASQNSQATKIIEQTNVQTQEVISRAQRTAEGIVKQADAQSLEINKKIMEKMSLIVEEAVSEYVDQHYSKADQEKLAIKSVKDIEIK